MKQMDIRMITDPDQKQTIARTVLEALTDWFGVTESREEYIRLSHDWPFFTAMVQEKPAGFLCLKKTGPKTIELAVMGVLKEYQRQGTGRALFQAAREYAVKAGYEFMQVKTVQSGWYEEYDATNRFYQSLGFQELEVIPTVWDEKNPCQIYIMSLKKETSAIDLIMSRHSYRGRYRLDKVPREDLKTILEAGLAAPSGCNMQTTSLIAVDDESLLKEILSVIDPPVAKTAPALICVLTQRIPAYRDKCFAVQDYAAAIENILLAAVSLGYQSCWYEGHITDDDRICDRIAKILNVPDDYELVCILPIGKAETEPLPAKKKAFSERAWFNGFQTDSE